MWTRIVNACHSNLNWAKTPHLGVEALAHAGQAQQLVRERVPARAAAAAAAGLRAGAEQVRQRAAGEAGQRAKALHAHAGRASGCQCLEGKR